MINIKKPIFIFVLCVSILLNIVLGILLFGEVQKIMHDYRIQQLSVKNLDFTKMFIEKVLMANQDIDFNTRMNLETAVRGLNDADIFDQWQKFVNAIDKTDASSQAKILLDLLIKKIEK